MHDDKPDPGDTREGGGPAQSSMTIRVYKTGPDGQRQLVSARIVGPREQLTRDEGQPYSACTCPTCKRNGQPAEDAPLRSGE
ncbi:hypothetical protein OG539_32970 [Actinacidiphila glaucinigra]|uniref:hypothetical protein n=1 Tax=Actinacidiphila glaucinigra TaxID=235986 RepID=UPI0032491101